MDGGGSLVDVMHVSVMFKEDVIEYRGRALVPCAVCLRACLVTSCKDS